MARLAGAYEQKYTILNVAPLLLQNMSVYSQTVNFDTNAVDTPNMKNKLMTIFQFSKVSSQRS
jgi:hypothetical protein